MLSREACFSGQPSPCRLPASRAAVIAAIINGASSGATCRGMLGVDLWHKLAAAVSLLRACAPQELGEHRVVAGVAACEVRLGEPVTFWFLLRCHPQNGVVRDVTRLKAPAPRSSALVRCSGDLYKDGSGLGRPWCSTARFNRGYAGRSRSYSMPRFGPVSPAVPSENGGAHEPLNRTVIH